jgi:hypothetical protein
MFGVLLAGLSCAAASGFKCDQKGRGSIHDSVFYVFKFRIHIAVEKRRDLRKWN